MSCYLKTIKCWWGSWLNIKSLLSMCGTIFWQMWKDTNADIRSTLKGLNLPLCKQAVVLIKATVFVGEEGHAILPTSVQDSFSSYARALLTATNVEGEVVEVSKLVPSSWILSNLTAILKHHMSCSCQAHKYGTLPYRSNWVLLSPCGHA